MRTYMNNARRQLHAKMARRTVFFAGRLGLPDMRAASLSSAFLLDARGPAAPSRPSEISASKTSLLP